MTIAEFQNTIGPRVKIFLSSQDGTEYMNAIGSLKPALSESFPSEHAMTRAYAKIEGYELCMRHMIALTMVPKSVTQPEANYGVPDRKPTE